MPKDSNWNLGPLGYLGLLVSVLLNISGMSSIVQGFVELGGFLGDLVGQYRTWIREPIRLGFSFIWIPLPGWLADWLCITGSFMVAQNSIWLLRDGRAYFGTIAEEFKNGDYGMVAFGLLNLILGPLYAPLIYALIYLGEGRAGLKAWNETILNNIYALWFSLLGFLVLLLFLNWQGQKLGYW
jgi:hypothetical protein